MPDADVFFVKTASGYDFTVDFSEKGLVRDGPVICIH